MFKHLEKLIALSMVLFAIGYNLWLYQLEPTALIDPNDNPFQYALVHRTNEMWDLASTTCPKNPLYLLCFVGYLVDHPVPNWAQGYSLPYYYSHIPQITIVASYRFFSAMNILPFITQSITHYTLPQTTYQTPLFSYYHVVIYLLLCLFPLSVFIATRVIKLPYVIAGFGALIATHLSTDGLYGLDPSSFLWRGYGLSSQLFAMIWMPLAIAFAFRFFQEKMPPIRTIKDLLTLRTILESIRSIFQNRFFFPSVVFLTFSIMGHLGLGVITMLSLGILALSKPLVSILYKRDRDDTLSAFVDQMTRLVTLAGSAILILSYWIIPVFLHNEYHNISFWDPVWKFNSYGWKEVLTYFLNGDLFDFGRFPWLSILVLIGLFAGFIMKQRLNNPSKEDDTSTIDHISSYSSFSVLFIFWLVMFFGRTTWGGLIDLIPSMKEFHQSRFIVGVQLSGFFLIPLGMYWFVSQSKAIVIRLLSLLKTSAQLLIDEEGSSITQKGQLRTSTTTYVLVVTLILSVISAFLVYPQTYRYAKHNDFLIKRGNENFLKQNPDMEVLFESLNKLPPGRVFTGRGGAWGKELEIAETTYFMHLSTYGIPVILWLPETWSPNSDVEQFFIDDWSEHYDLMNVRYVVTPKTVEAKPFWKKMNETASWILYEVPTTGYFTTGSHAAVVYASKQHFVNVVRLWMQSDYVKQRIVPQLTYSYKEMMNSSLPAFAMTDETTYQLRDGKDFSIFGAPPSYEAPEAKVTVVGPEKHTKDVIYQTTISADPNCDRCLAILKHSFHPNWHAYINGKEVKTVTVFPFYIGVPVKNLTNATLRIQYEPSRLKLVLLVFGSIYGLSIVVLSLALYLSYRKSREIPS